jgi:CO/xanthine dehydrogenase FAD-binding subunit
MRTALEKLSIQRPRKLKDALSMMAEAAQAGAPLSPLSGGTDVYVALNAGIASAVRPYVDVWRLDELRGIAVEGETLVIGGLATYTDCIRSKDVQKRLPMLVAAAREVGGIQIQNRGTLAGNVGNASPAGDSLPVLAAADARVVLRSTSGEREVPLTEYYTGYRATVRRDDELITAVRIPLPAKTERQHFRKVGTRAAQAISKVMIAAVGNRIAFGSVAATVVRARTVESYLYDGGRDANEARELLLEHDVRPIDDVRSTADYRRRVAGNLLVEYLARRDRA